MSKKPDSANAENSGTTGFRPGLFFPADVAVDFLELSRKSYGRIGSMEELYGTIDGVNMLVRALSEMAKPCGYFVQADLDSSIRPALLDPSIRPALLNIRRPDGKWMASMCVTYPKGSGFSFPDRKSAAAALVSNYESRPAWDAQFFNSWEALRFPGGSPEELALKAAVGVKAVLRKV